ncbi:MAG: oligosaccharide flippase family protein [Chlorobiota bacterium]
MLLAKGSRWLGTGPTSESTATTAAPKSGSFASRSVGSQSRAKIGLSEAIRGAAELRSGRNVLWRLARDVVAYGITTVLVRFLTFLLTPVYTHALQPAELGEVSYVYAGLAFTMVFLTLGWESAYMRFAVEAPDQERRRIFTLAWSMVALNSLLAGALLWWGAPDVAEWLGLRHLGADGVRWAALIAVCDAVAVVPFAELRLRRRLGLFAALRLGNIVLMVAATVYFLFVLRWGALGVLGAGVLASAATAVAVSPLVMRQFRWGWRGELMRQMLRYGLPTVPAALAGIALHVLDRPLLMVLMDAAAVGLYQANYRLALPMLLMVSVFEYAWRPFFLERAEAADAPRLFARVFWHWNVAAAFVYMVLVLWMPVVVRIPLWGSPPVHPTYWEGLGVVPIVAAGYVALGIYTIAAAAVHIRKQTEHLSLAMGLAVLTNVGLIWLLVPHLGYVGAAWATAAAFAVAAGVMLAVGQRLRPVPYPWGSVGVAWAIVLAAVAVGSGDLVARGLGTFLGGLLLAGWWRWRSRWV